MGARLLAEWLTSPLTVARADRRAARRRRGAVHASRSSAATSGRCSSQSYDLERLAARVGTGRATPRDLVALARTLALLPKVKARLTARVSKRLNQLEAALELCPEVRGRDRGRAGRRPAAGRQGRGPDPRRLSCRARRAARQCPRRQVVDRQVPGRADPPDRDPEPQGRLQQGLRLLHRDHPRPGAAPVASIPSDYIRKQTVKNAERYITPELKEYEDEGLSAPRTEPASWNTSSSPRSATASRPRRPG